MNVSVIKVVKILVTVASLGVTVASNYLGDKELDAKIAAKVAEELAKKSK